MMAKFKTTPLEIANSMPKSLYDRVEQKWHYCLNLERQIRETSLAQVMPKLNKVQIAKAMKKYAIRFVPKYKAFSILQNNIEDVVKKSTQMQKLTYGLTIVKEGEEEPINVKDDDEEEDNENIVEGGTETHIDDKATVQVEQQEKQSVQDTQLLDVSHQHEIGENTETVIVKDKLVKKLKAKFGEGVEQEEEEDEEDEEEEDSQTQALLALTQGMGEEQKEEETEIAEVPRKNKSTKHILPQNKRRGRLKPNQ